MRKSFEDWHKIRTNESLGSIASGVGDAVMRKLSSKYRRRSDLRRSDPRNPNNIPGTPEEVRNNFESKYLPDFISKLNISGMNRNLKDSLINVGVARLYGKEYGYVKDTDLAIIWEALPLETKKILKRPYNVTEYVPEIRDDQKWTITPGALSYDKEEYEKLSKMPVSPARGTPGTPPGTSPIARGTPPPKTAGAKKALWAMYNRIKDIDAKLAAPTPPANAEELKDEKEALIFMRSLYTSSP